MTAQRRNPVPGPGERPASAGRWGLLLAVLLVAAGCKSKDGGGGGSGGGSPRNSDPLVVGPGRIPKQNLPIPDRGTGTAGTKGRADPLLGEPVGRPGRTGVGYADDPGRWKGGPYVPGPGGTPAALASRPKDDGDGLRIASVPSDGPPPTAGAPTAGSPAAELAVYGVKPGDIAVTREGGRVTVTVRVPIDGDGHVRGYTETGPTEAAALRQVVEQVKTDRK